MVDLASTSQEQEPLVVQALIYLRISYARAGEIESGAARRGEVLTAEKQLPACQRRCAELGWNIAEVYVEEGKSAYKGKRKVWERLLADAINSDVPGDAIVAWHPDRLTRQPTENSDLIKTVEQYGLRVATAMTGEHDLSTSSGKLHFRMLGDIAAYESEHRAERVIEHHDRLAEAGRWHGGRRPFGYRYCPDGGIELDPVEAPAVKAAGLYVIETDEPKLTRIAREWRDAGLFTSKGGRPVTVTNIARLLRSPHLVGDRVHRGKVTKQGAWPAILTREQQAIIVAKLDANGRTLVDRHATELGGMLTCGNCDGVMRGATLKAAGRVRQPGYRCDFTAGGCGRIHRLAAPIDQEVKDRIIEALAGPKLQAKLAKRAEGRLTAEQAQALRGEQHTLRGKLAQLENLGDVLPEETVTAAKREIDQRLLVISRKQRAGIQLGPLAGLPTTKAGLERAWAGWSTGRRREVSSALCPEIRIRHLGRGGRANPTIDVKIRWRI